MTTTVRVPERRILADDSQYVSPDSLQAIAETDVTADPRKLPDLSHDEILRYSRHLLLPDVGVEGQRKLKAARVLLIGAGGLGSPLALYLAAAGVGNIGIVDFDVVDVTNLQRQVLHGTSDVGRSKIESARKRLTDVNPFVLLTTYEEALTSANAMKILQGYDLVVDGTDNFPTRYLVNDACVLLGIPNVYGSIYRFEGQASVFATKDGPCYRCLYPEPPPPGLVPSCAEGGVLGVLPGLVGTIQATEAIKLILGIGESLSGRLLLIDALGANFRTVMVRKDPACPACGTRKITQLIDYEQFCGSPHVGGDPKVSLNVPEITPTDAAARLAKDEIDIVDVREPHELAIAKYPKVIAVPLGQLADRIAELPRDRDLVLACRSGVRSAKAVQQLQAAGFTRVWNLAGGIHRWIEEVDPSQPKY
ncbi:MAG: molybdopterin-synthase adenylyltransferase MoeB [Gemmatimonadetes bacterium]|nr:molybdopterin-synthase adenylyltransferase MoeB [Gemmatimonadota bacterium]